MPGLTLPETKPFRTKTSDPASSEMAYKMESGGCPARSSHGDAPQGHHVEDDVHQAVGIVQESHRDDGPRTMKDGRRRQRAVLEHSHCPDGRVLDRQKEYDVNGYAGEKDDPTARVAWERIAAILKSAAR